MHTLTKPTEAAMTAIAEKMAEQREVKFRKITTDINCAIHGFNPALPQELPLSPNRQGAIFVFGGCHAISGY